MANPLDYHLRGLLKPEHALSGERKIWLPDFDLDLAQLYAPISEGFEGATFPPPTPIGAWASPSPNYPSDLAWERTTSGPLVGTASAQRPAAQTHSQSSSMQLRLALSAPARVAFLFSVVAEDNADFLLVYVDGVNVLKASSASQRTGRFVSDVLAPGSHTVDWRFTKDAATTQGGELAKVDSVEVWPESRWSDVRSYIQHSDDFLAVDPRWNTGVLGAGAGVALLAGYNGYIRPLTGSAANDYAWMEFGPGGNLCRNNEVVLEGKFLVASLSDVVVEFGLWIGWGSGGSYQCVAANFNSSASAQWRIRHIASGSETVAPHTATAATGYHTFRLVIGAAGTCLLVDGVAVQTGTNQAVALSSGAPSATTALRPYFSVQTLAAGQKSLFIDYFRVVASRV